MQQFQIEINLLGVGNLELKTLQLLDLGENNSCHVLFLTLQLYATTPIFIRIFSDVSSTQNLENNLGMSSCICDPELRNPVPK